MMKIVIVALVIYLLNIPFGYWRGNVKKFSLQWALAVHIPVPFVVLLRIYSGMGFELYTYPILVGAFFGGQFSGKKLFMYWKSQAKEISSCLVMDSIKIVRGQI